MQIDNKKEIDRIRVGKMITNFVFLAVILLLLFIEFLPKENKFNDYHIMIIVAVVFILFSLVRGLRKPYYFFFTDKEDILVFRYFPIGLLASKKNSIEIPKKHFTGYKITKFFLGDKQLILSQRYRNKEASYPPISLSAVNKKDREKLILILNTYTQKN